MNYLRNLQLRRMMSADGTGGGAQPAGSGTQAPGATQTTQGETPPPTTPPEGGQAAAEAAKTYTQADLDAAVSRTLAKERAKAEKLAAEARTEGEKLARMSAEERSKAEREAQEKDYAARVAEVTKRELRATAADELSKKGLPLGLVDILNYADADACNASIASVEKAFQAAVQAGVEARLRNSEIPKASNGAAATKAWKDMTLDEQGALYRAKPEEARRLAKAAGTNLGA